MVTASLVVNRFVFVYSLTLCRQLGNCSCFCCGLLTVFFKIDFFKNAFMDTIGVSNGLGPDQDRRSVDPDLCPPVCKGYQQLTKVAASKKRVNLTYCLVFIFSAACSRMISFPFLNFNQSGIVKILHLRVPAKYLKCPLVNNQTVHTDSFRVHSYH